MPAPFINTSILGRRLSRWVVQESQVGAMFTGDGRYPENWLWGAGGGDTISGAGAANTTIWGYGGNDSLSAGACAAEIYGGLGDDRINGSRFGDKLHGELGNDTIWGQGGNDSIQDDGGRNYIYGGDGDDQISSNARLLGSFISGESGNDTIKFGNYAGSRAYGGNGNDTISGSADGSDFEGDAGNDSISIDGSILGHANDIFGGSGNDTIAVDYGRFDIYGGDGADRIIIRDTTDTVTLHYESFSEGGDAIYGLIRYDKIDLRGAVAQNNNVAFFAASPNDHRIGAVSLRAVQSGYTLDYYGYGSTLHLNFATTQPLSNNIISW